MTNTTNQTDSSATNGDAEEAAELQTLLTEEFACYRPTYPAGLYAWARIALLDNSPHHRPTTPSPNSSATSGAAVQWRNIQKVVKELAKFCFGDGAQCGYISYGAAYTAVVSSLSAKDGLRVELEPLPATPAPQAATPLPEMDKQALMNAAALLNRAANAIRDPARCSCNADELDAAANPLYRAALTQQAAPEAPAIAQHVWIVNDDKGEPVMLCPQEPSAEMLAELAVKIGKSVEVEAYLLFPAATTVSASIGDDPNFRQMLLIYAYERANESGAMVDEETALQNLIAYIDIRAQVPSREQPHSAAPNEVRAERRMSACRDAEIADLRAALAPLVRPK